MINNEPVEQLDISRAISLVKDYLLDLQRRVCDFLEVEDGQSRFIEEEWRHPSGGGGRTRVLAGTAALEKAGVNFSHVYGIQLPQAATVKRSELANAAFQALGVSIIVHPYNPYAPTTHANVRFIVVEQTNGTHTWWIGGGWDLTPYYGFIEDCINWHNTAKQACAPFGDEIYARYKKWRTRLFCGVMPMYTIFNKSIIRC